MPIRIAPEGYIIGGICDREHRDRAARHRGITAAAHWYTESGIVASRAGWLTLTTKKIPRLTMKEIVSKTGGSAQEEIGWYRFAQDFIPAWRRYGKAIRRRFLDGCLHDLAGLQMVVKAETPLGPFEFGHAPAHQPGIYEKRIANGTLRQ